MKVEGVIKFDRWERRTIATAARSIRIAYPKLEDATEAQRPLNALAQGGEGHHRATVDRAIQTTEAIIAACESDAEKFKAYEIADADGGRKRAMQASSVPVFLNFKETARVLVEAREVQAREARAALELLFAASDLLAVVNGQEVHGG